MNHFWFLKSLQRIELKHGYYIFLGHVRSLLFIFLIHYLFVEVVKSDVRYAHTHTHTKIKSLDLILIKVLVLEAEK